MAGVFLPLLKQRLFCADTLTKPFSHGQAPLLTIYDGERYEGESLVESRDKWTVMETHFLHEYESKEDINDMMLERG